jgi:hypothetical protein
VTENVEGSDWPGYPKDAQAAEVAKIVYQAQVDIAKAGMQRDQLRADRDWEAENELFKGFHASVRSTAQTLAGAKQANAELVQKAAAAILTIYTGIVGAVFAVSTNPLPPRGLLPALFLAAAVALSTAYVAYLTGAHDTALLPGGSARENARAYTNAFIDWINARLDARSTLLRASVLALAAGLVLLPAPFLDIHVETVTEQAEPTWPPYPTGDAAVELKTELFKTQLAEAAASRSAQRATISVVTPARVFETSLDIAEVAAWILAAVLALAVWKLAPRQ